jgi:hypothetical protein
MIGKDKFLTAGYGDIIYRVPFFNESGNRSTAPEYAIIGMGADDQNVLCYYLTSNNCFF